jgi:hypothetical protein
MALLCRVGDKKARHFTNTFCVGAHTHLSVSVHWFADAGIEAHVRAIIHARVHIHTETNKCGNACVPSYLHTRTRISMH